MRFIRSANCESQQAPFVVLSSQAPIAGGRAIAIGARSGIEHFFASRRLFEFLTLNAHHARPQHALNTRLTKEIVSEWNPCDNGQGPPVPWTPNELKNNGTNQDG